MNKKIVSGKNFEKEEDKEDISIIIEATYLGEGNYKYIISSNKNLRLGTCNIF